MHEGLCPGTHRCWPTGCSLRRVRGRAWALECWPEGQAVMDALGRLLVLGMDTGRAAFASSLPCSAGWLPHLFSSSRFLVCFPRGASSALSWPYRSLGARLCALPSPCSTTDTIVFITPGWFGSGFSFFFPGGRHLHTWPLLRSVSLPLALLFPPEGSYYMRLVPPFYMWCPDLEVPARGCLYITSLWYPGG